MHVVILLLLFVGAVSGVPLAMLTGVEGICLREAMRPSADAEQVALPEKWKTQT